MAQHYRSQLVQECAYPYAKVEDVAELVARVGMEVNELRDLMGTHVVMHAITAHNLPLVKYFYSIGTEYEDRHILCAAQVSADDVFMWLAANKVVHPITEKLHARLCETLGNIIESHATPVHFEAVIAIERLIGNPGRGLDSPESVWAVIAQVDNFLDSIHFSRRLDSLDRAAEYVGLPMQDILACVRARYPDFPRSRVVLSMFLAGGARAGLGHVRVDEMLADCLDQWDQQRHPLQRLANGVEVVLEEFTNPYIATNAAKYLVSDPK